MKCNYITACSLSLVLQPTRRVHAQVKQTRCGRSSFHQTTSFAPYAPLLTSITRFNYSSLYIHFSRIKTRSLIFLLIRKKYPGLISHCAKCRSVLFYF